MLNVSGVRALVKIICEPCFVDYQSTAVGILRNKRSGEDGFRSEGTISRVICKPVSALSNHITFEGRALLKIICEPCFVDYQSTAIGILRNKGSGEDGFRSEGKFLV